MILFLFEFYGWESVLYVVTLCNYSEDYPLWHFYGLMYPFWKNIQGYYKKAY